MIQADQPRIFGRYCTVAVSSQEDGTMTFRGNDPDQVVKNRQAFLEKVGINLSLATLVQVTYDDDFARYHTVNDSHKGEGMSVPQSKIIADALVTTSPNHALFLPIADCCAVVLFDPVKKILMVSHVGRQSVEVDGARRSVKYLIQNHAVDPTLLLVWLSPAVGKATYPLYAFDNRGLHEVIVHQLKRAGVKKENIEVSGVDTAFDNKYFSHSQYRAGARNDDGRFAVVAMMP